MDFTREPVLETIITPKEGFRIVVRNSKVPGQEEYSVDALEVVSFGSHCFYRNLERPKAFLVPASDYEIIEAREGKMTFKMASSEGLARLPPPPRESARSAPKEKEIERKEANIPQKAPAVREAPEESSLESRKKDRRPKPRRRRPGREETEEEGRVAESVPEQPAPKVTVGVTMPSVLPPPTTLIRDDLERLRKDEQYKGAFFPAEEVDEEPPVLPPSLQREEEPGVGSEASLPPQDVDMYKATPAPLEDEDTPQWRQGPAVRH